jgi:membrane fusion protein
MSNTSQASLSLRRQPRSSKAGNRLFRTAACRAEHNQAFGSPSVVIPPTASAAVGFAVVLVSLLVAASWLVEVPQIVTGAGVIMPGEGLIPIAASAQGHVTEVLVREKQQVKKGDVLMRLSSDANAATHQSRSRLELESLEHELALREQSDDQRQTASDQRVSLADSRVVALNRQAASLQQQLRARNTTIEIAQRRVRRMSRLLDGGGVSPDQLDSVKGQAVDAQVAVHELRNRITQLAADIEAVQAKRLAELTAMKLQSLDSAVAREHLQREIQSTRQRLVRDIIAAQDSMVSRVQVVAGETVRPGQPLLMLQTGGAELEAWLYVATASGGTVRPGQAIELRIDAFPHQIYGTQKAIVESVSAIALRPAELRVPLALRGPVFEVRAHLLAKENHTAANRWPLIAGLSFEADILQSKHRLYRWLLRHALSPDGFAGG